MNIKELATSTSMWQKGAAGRHAILISIDLEAGDKAVVVTGEATNMIAMLIAAMQDEPAPKTILSHALQVVESEGFQNYMKNNANLN